MLKNQPPDWLNSPLELPKYLPLPNASANPQIHHMNAAIEKLVRILATIVPAFFPREKPISSRANPACMKITSVAATTTQRVFTELPTLKSDGTALASWAIVGP
jgi:hypothetical protein